MTALPTPNLPPNAHRDQITRFREEYAALVDEAHAIAETTATTAWQAMYATHRREVGRERVRIATMLRTAAEAIDSASHTEDDEKVIADAKKAATTLRDRIELFDRETVEPMRSPSTKAANLIVVAKSGAERDEMAAPLTSSGLAELMREAVASVPVIRWDDDTGRLTVGGAA